jgi:hypothetical protein
MTLRTPLFLWLLLSTSIAFASSRELWAKEIGKVTSPNWAGQIFADGTGGVAATFQEPINNGLGSRCSVVWLNLYGKEIHRKSFDIPDTNGLGWDIRIIAATRQGLVVWFFTENGNEEILTSQTFVISRSGEEAEVDEVTETEGLRRADPANHYHDATGYFSFRFRKDGTLSLVRRSFR